MTRKRQRQELVSVLRAFAKFGDFTFNDYVKLIDQELTEPWKLNNPTPNKWQRFVIAKNELRVHFSITYVIENGRITDFF